MKHTRVLGICGAQGALLFSFKRDFNYEVVGNFEPRGMFHTPKEEQWKSNFPGIPFWKRYEDMIEAIGKSNIDIMVGSPSCGHSSIFSYSRKKSLGEPKEDPTLNYYLRAVKEVKPKVWIMENLPQMLKSIPLGEWEEKFPEYKFISHCYSVADFGNSQVSRKRLVLIGVRMDCLELKVHFERVFRVNTPKLFGELYKKRRPKMNYTEAGARVLSMYDSRLLPMKRNLMVKEVRKLWRNDFKGEFKWPMPGTKMKTLPGVYKNRADAYPLTARPSSRQFNHRGSPMGLEEYRLIMGFPEAFLVYFPRDHRRRVAKDKVRNYWLNKGRISLTKGAVYEIGKWAKLCSDRAFVMVDKKKKSLA